MVPSGGALGDGDGDAEGESEASELGKPCTSSCHLSGYQPGSSLRSIACVTITSLLCCICTSAVNDSKASSKLILPVYFIVGQCQTILLFIYG